MNSAESNPGPSRTTQPTVLDYSTGAKRPQPLPFGFRVNGAVLNALVILAFSEVRYSWLDLGFTVGPRLLDFRRGYWSPRLLFARAAVLALIAATFVRDASWYRAMNTAAIALILGAWFCMLYDFADWIDQDAMWIFAAMCVIRTLHVAFAKRGEARLA